MKTSPQAIIYHDRCRDGTCGLCIVNQYLQSLGHENNLFIPGVYQNYKNIFDLDLSQHEIHFVDFSLPQEEMAALANKSKKITVLDHHDWALEAYADCLEKDGSTLKGKFLPNVEIILDKTKSGALLAWDYLMQTPAPEFVNYISDGDLYAFKLKGAHEFAARLGLEKENIESYNPLLNMNKEQMAQFLQEGKILNTYFEQIAQKAAQKTSPIKITIGKKEYFGDLAVASSEISNRVAEIIYNRNNTFAAILTQVLPNQYKLSLRSKAPHNNNSVYDVKEIAAFFGGNGHLTAAGCYVDKKAFDQHFTFLTEVERKPKNKM